MGIKQDYQHILDDERLSDFEKNNIYVLTNGNVVVIDEDGERRGLFGNGQHTVWLDFENHEKLGDMTKLSDLIRIDNLETAIRDAERRIADLEYMCDNAHEALVAVRDSGTACEDDVMSMLEKGLDNVPQNGGA